MAEIDARGKSVTEINRAVRSLAASGEEIVIDNPDARHLLCVGLLARAKVTIRGSAGYFCGGLSDGPSIEVQKFTPFSIRKSSFARFMLARFVTRLRRSLLPALLFFSFT